MDGAYAHNMVLYEKWFFFNSIKNAMKKKNRSIFMDKFEQILVLLNFES
jgi:hypothetical protein